MGFERLVRLRQDGRHLVSTMEFTNEHGRACHACHACHEYSQWSTRSGVLAVDYWHGHVYASRNRPISSLWACLSADRADVLGAVYVDANYAETGIWTWVVTPAPLDERTVRRYELTWAWGPTSRQKEIK